MIDSHNQICRDNNTPLPATPFSPSPYQKGQQLFYPFFFVCYLLSLVVENSPPLIHRSICPNNQKGKSSAIPFSMCLQIDVKPSSGGRQFHTRLTHMRPQPPALHRPIFIWIFICTHLTRLPSLVFNQSPVLF